MSSRKAIGRIILFFTCAFCINGSIAGCVNQTVILKDPISDTAGVTLPNIPLEKLGKKYYYFGAIFEGNYFQATQYCNYHGMSLLSVETKEENDFLWEKFKHFLGHGEYFFWTSGTTLPDAHWVWLATGKPIIYANWFPNQPDNAGGNENCLEVRYAHTNKALMWNDHVCTAQKHVICETEEVRCISNLVAENIPRPV